MGRFYVAARCIEVRHLSRFDELEFVYRSSHSKVKTSDSNNFCNQASNSRAAVSEIYLGKAGNITEVPPTGSRELCIPRSR